MTIQMHVCFSFHVYIVQYCVTVHVAIRDLQYISIWQYINTLIEYRIVILCSINIEISKCLIVLSGARLMLLI